MRIEIQYLKKIFYTTFFLQFCFFIIFGTIQAPGVVAMIQGINIGFINIIFIILLSLIEYSNFIILSALVLAIFWILYSDFILNDMKIMFLQIGLNSNKLLYCCIINNLLFCNIFFINNLFFTPYSNFILRSRLLNVVKRKIVYMIEPHCLLKTDLIKKLGKLNMIISEKKDDSLYGCIVSNENFKIMMVIKKFTMEHKDMINIKINNGKIVIKDVIECDINFDNSNIKVDSDIITIKKKKNLLSNFNAKELVSIFKLILVTIVLAFVGFIIVFGSNMFYKMISFMFFFIILLDSINLIHLSYIMLILLYLILLYIFYTIKKCLNF